VSKATIDRPYRDPILNDLTRREFVTGLLAAGLLAACGGSGSDQPNSRSWVRMIDNEFGSTEAPADPKRIAVLDVRAVEHLVALGVIPNAVFVEPAPFLAQALDGAVSVQNDAGEVNLELLAGSRPDLIIAWEAFIEGKVEEIKKIAPTVGIRHDSFTEWIEPFRFTASVVGREEKAEEVVSAYEARTAEMRSRLAERGLDDFEVSVVRGHGEILRLAGADESFPAGVLDAVGLKRTQVQHQDTAFGEIDMSFEQIPMADADIIFLMRSPDAFHEAITVQALGHPLWQNLRAAKSGQVHDVTLDHWLQGGPLAAGLILDDIEGALLS
jgi:iron complex transport system substrate-binding protein